MRDAILPTSRARHCYKSHWVTMIGGKKWEYLAKVLYAGYTYEAHVTVTPSHWSRLEDEWDAEFCSSYCYVDGVIDKLDEQCSEVVQLMLLDDAREQHIAEKN